MERDDSVEPTSETPDAIPTLRHHRRRLVALLSDPRLDGTRLVARLRELRSLEGLAACSAAVRVLAGLDLPEERAESLLVELASHRAAMSECLGRDPGPAVAAADYLAHVAGLSREPVFVELSHLDRSERMAITDPLTGRFDRRYFLTRLATEIRRSQRFAGPLSLVTYDLDSFQPVNDVYGHPLGDQVLRRAGQLIARAARESDVAGRTGGDEFAVLLPATSRLGAFAAAERSRQRLASQFASQPLDGRLVAMTASAGVACFPDDGATPEALLGAAGRAVARAKARGGNEVVIHPAEKRRAVRWPARGALEATLALRGGGRAYAARALDLSERGALVDSPAQCERSQAVSMTLRSRAGTHVVPAWVVRVEKGHDREARRLALAFERPLPGPVVLESAQRGARA